MQTILARAGCFIAIIVLGYLLRKFKFFPDETFTVLSKIVIKVTLPATIVCNFAGREFEPTLLAIIFVALGGNILYLAVTFLLGKRPSREDLVFDLEEYHAAYDHLHAEGLKIRRGMEYGITPLNRELFVHDAAQNDYDFIIGSGST